MHMNAATKIVPTTDLTALELAKVSADAEIRIEVVSRHGHIVFEQGYQLGGDDSRFMAAGDRFERIAPDDVLRAATSVLIKSDSMENTYEIPAADFAQVAELLAPALDYARSELGGPDAEVTCFTPHSTPHGPSDHERHATTAPKLVDLQTRSGRRKATIAVCTRCCLHFVEPA
jgi:hypothetical protein